MVELPEKCPVCGGKMEKAFLYMSKGETYWSDKTATFPLQSEELFGSLLRFTSIEAYRCPTCKVVMFSYEKESKDRT